jgi:hypothetical protein
VHGSDDAAKKEERLLADGQQHNSSSKIKFKKKLEKTGALQLILEMQDPVHTPQGAQKNTKHAIFHKRQFFIPQC